jgi:acid phosphatase
MEIKRNGRHKSRPFLLSYNLARRQLSEGISMKSAFLPLFLPIAFAASLAGQSTPVQSPLEQTIQPPVELRNLGTLRNELKQYHDCVGGFGCYRDDLRAQTDRAQAALAARVAARKPDEKLAIVFDSDETVLSNWPELEKLSMGFYQPLVDEWERSEKAEAIPGSVALYKQALASGVTVFFITGRPEAMREVTAANLRNQRMTEWKALVLRSQDEEGETAVMYKSSERRKIVAQGYTIVMSIGDQWSDLEGDPHAEISVKLPNPFYFIP